MEDFPSNNGRSVPKRVADEKTKAEPKKVEKVIEGSAIRRKKPLGKRFAETFVGGDAKGVGAYVMFDVLIPAAKDAVADAMSQGVEKMLFGEARSTSRRGSRGSSSAPLGHIAYNRMGGSSRVNRPDPRETALSRRARATHDFDEIVLATRVEAEEVIDRLFDLVSRFEMATVADLYDLIGETSNFADNKWGWTDLRGAGATRVRNGYLLDLPRPEPLD